MIAYVTTTEEKTTEICIEQLRRFDFAVVILDGKKPWIEKYKEFILLANSKGEACLRVDADVILNQKIKSAHTDLKSYDSMLMLQYCVYDLYQNDIQIGQPVLYSPDALAMIKKHINDLDILRPETSAWRMSAINPFTMTIDEVVGMHGFFQAEETVRRAEQNKILRRQEGKYDFALVDKLMKL